MTQEKEIARLHLPLPISAIIGALRGIKESYPDDMQNRLFLRGEPSGTYIIVVEKLISEPTSQR